MPFVVTCFVFKNNFFSLKQLYFYGYNQVPVASWRNHPFMFPLLITLALLLFALMRIGKKILWRLAFCFIFSHFVYLHLFSYTGRYHGRPFSVYVLDGLCIFFVFMVCNLFKTDFSKLELSSLLRTQKQRFSRFPLRILFSHYCLAGNQNLFAQQGLKDNVSLVSTDLPVLENCARAHNYYADELKRRLYNTFNEVTEKK